MSGYAETRQYPTATLYGQHCFHTIKYLLLARYHNLPPPITVSAAPPLCRSSSSQRLPRSRSVVINCYLERDWSTKLFFRSNNAILATLATTHSDQDQSGNVVYDFGSRENSNSTIRHFAVAHPSHVLMLCPDKSTFSPSTTLHRVNTERFRFLLEKTR